MRRGKQLVWGWIGVLLVAGSPALAKEAGLPAEWHGDWQGQLHLVAGDEVIPMAILVEPTEGGLRWRTTYGEGPDADVRDYLLIPVEGSPGRYQVDEKNGIFLDVSLIGDTLHSLFVVGQSILSMSWRLEGETIHFETRYASTEATLSGGPEHGVPAVSSYVVTSVRRASLKRQP